MEILGFFAAFLGAITPGLIQLGYARRTRVEDAYVELAGACQVLLRLSSPLSRGMLPEEEAAWLRFGVARAKTLLHERDYEIRKRVKALAQELEEEIGLVSVPLGREDFTPDEKLQIIERHLKKVKKVGGSLDELLDCVRARFQSQSLT